jgi:hypothetical protein
MAVQNQVAGFIQSRLDSLNLTDNIDAVSILFHHAGNSPDVTLNGFQPVQRLSIFHLFSKPLLVNTPPQGGVGMIILARMDMIVKPSFSIFPYNNIKAILLVFCAII